jgi:hypothetical protein
MMVSFNPSHAGRALILRSLLRNDDVYFLSRQLAAWWLIFDRVHLSEPAFGDVISNPRAIQVPTALWDLCNISPVGVTVPSGKGH